MIYAIVWLKLAVVLIVLLVLVCVWLYTCARDAEEIAGRWRAEAKGWQSLAEDANDSAQRVTGFAQDAVNALAARHAELDERDAEIERLRAVRQEYIARVLDKRLPARWIEWVN